MDYKVVKYSEIGKIRSGKRLPKGYTVSEEISDNKYIRVRDINNGSIDSSIVQYITDEAAEKLERYRVKTRDVIISVVGTVGAIAQIDESLNGAYLTENCDNLQVDESLCLKDYLKYYLLSEGGNKEIIANTVGSTQPKLPIYGIENFNIKLPSIDNQKRIVKILNSIDKKVKLNNEINNNLHELLKNQYYKMFVEDRKDSWIDDKLGNYLSVDRGLSYKGQFLSESGVPMINLGNVMPNGVFRIEKNKYYSGDYKDKVTIKVGDVVVANTDMTQNREVIGTPVIVPPIYEDKIIFSHHIYGLRNLKLPKMYIFYTLLTDEWNAIAGGSATGTTVLALPKETIENYVITIPDNESLKLFDNIAENIQSKRSQILLENIKLEQLRDTLLPKLMNGEIDLDNIEI